jgi:hypothetical protein
MNIAKLEEKLAKTKNAAEKAELFDLINNLKKEESKEESVKIMNPVRDATPVADHKNSRIRAKGEVIITDKMMFM